MPPKFRDARTKRLVENRERIGRRWYGLKGEALAKFVEDDADVRARIAVEAAADVAELIALSRSLVNNPAALAELRQEMGDGEFEKLFALLEALAKRE